VPNASKWLVNGLSTPQDIALDATRVYWSDPGNGSVNAISKAGGAVVPLASGQAQPRRIAVEGAYVYWGNYLGGAIMRALKDGTGSPELVATATSPLFISADASYVYFSGESQRAIWRTPKAAGSVAESLATFANIESMAFDGSTLLVLGTTPTGSGTWIYRVNPATGATVQWMPVHGRGLVADANHIAWLDNLPFDFLWTNNDPKVVWGQRVHADSIREPISLASCGILWFRGSATPTTTLYLSRFGSDNPISLTAVTSGPGIKAIADDAAVYWIDGSGAIGKTEL
jgi:hypothetical protein